MKRAEILQLAMLQPKFAVLDETDSGLDADAVRLAWSLTESGDAILFSPAAASFDAYKNFRARAMDFRGCVASQAEVSTSTS